ncbi:hypothetical protein TAMA11512_23070 [Selenomonas sp. TAMA-11512]|uniref:hypothetical protein n=1 Tax=Selenomonas sp. TAMA-11512 TaxID=3095337 RepID=UPI0030915C0E|nr:hypothetical protein TAMA11512_23070 [Selenomonas sp. TAMA-11512]
MTESDQRRRIEEELTPDERVLWTGCPSTSFFSLLTKADIFILPFSIIWAAGAGFASVAMLLGESQHMMSLLIAPFFLAVAVYITIGRFLLKVRLRRKTVYGLTDRRALICRGQNTSFILFDRMRTLEKSIRDDGSGTIYLMPDAKPGMFSSLNRNAFQITPDAKYAFVEIDDAKEAYDIIRKHILEAKDHSS